MSDDLVVDFAFVPNGASFPHDWVRRHPDYISLPARFKGTPAQFRRFMGRRMMPSRDGFEKSDLQSVKGEAVGAISLFEPMTITEPAPKVDKIGPAARLPVHLTPQTVGQNVLSDRLPDETGHNSSDGSQRDPWTGIRIAELLGPGMAQWEKIIANSLITTPIESQDRLDIGVDRSDFSLGSKLASRSDKLGTAGKVPPQPDSVELAAAGDLKCQGFAGGCANGGSSGSTGMFMITGRILCWSCATKMLGLGNLKAGERLEILQPFALRAK